MAFSFPQNHEADFLAECMPENRESFLAACQAYGEILYKTNETMNLTRIPPEAFWSKHVCDSLSILRELPEEMKKKNLNVCDTGCGAGLPSLILAAAMPHWKITAVDSTGKKIEFVKKAAQAMNLANLTAVHGRANELGRKAPYKGAFDMVTARAVADAAVLLRETAGFRKKNAPLAIYRTIQQAEPEMELLEKKFRFHATEEFDLPGDAGKRMFLFIYA